MLEIRKILDGNRGKIGEKSGEFVKKLEKWILSTPYENTRLRVDELVMMMVSPLTSKFTT